MYGHNMVHVNEHDGRKVFQEDYLVAMEIDLWNIGIHMAYKFLNFFSQSICNFEKKSSKLTHPHINLLSFEDLQKSQYLHVVKHEIMEEER